MGIASGDFSGDGLPDLFVTNSRGETHAVYRHDPTGAAFTDVRAGLTPVFGTNGTGWGVSWVDLNRDGILDLVLANGGIPVTGLLKDAGPIQVLDNLSAPGSGREVRRRRRPARVATWPVRQRSRGRRRRLQQRRQRRHRDQHDRRAAAAAARTRTRPGTGSRSRSPGSSPTRSSPPSCRTVGDWSARSMRAAATSRRRTRGRSSGWATRRRWPS